MAHVHESSSGGGKAVGDPVANVTAIDQQDASDAPLQGGFLFIASTGHKTKDRQQLRTLRGHVMHNYLERRDAGKHEGDANQAGRVSLSTGQPQLGIPKPFVSGGQKMRFRMRSGELELRHSYRYRKGKKWKQRNATEDERDGEPPAKESSATTEQHVATDSGFVPGMPVTWLGSRKIDVFGVSPVKMDQGDETSLFLFQQYERYPWCPINGQSSWSSFVVSDQLVFHATMFSWGMHFRHRRPVPDPHEEMKTLQHKVAAISLINGRLSDLERAATDETVAAVAALTNIALVVDSHVEASKHMAGLWAIVQMRGGLSSLKSNVQQHLQRLISWNDLIYSEVFDEKLRFPPIEVWDESWGTLERRHTTSGSLPGLSRAELQAAGVPHHQVIDLLSDICELCDAEQTSPLRLTHDQGRMRRADMFHRMERKLWVIVQGDATLGDNRWDAIVWRAVSLSALLFTHHYLRGNPLKYRHFNVLSTQLYDTLLAMDQDLAELDFAPSLLIWMLSTGAVTTSLFPVVHSSFIFMLGRACVKHGLVDYNRFQRTLSQFLWTGEADEARYSRLWHELEPAMQASYLEAAQTTRCIAHMYHPSR
ncbi:hypothetical protein A1O7_02182 [Cladophialophora yegresii CBS 114405]|uniref:Transcription factor domain-containing protein n=1 Tax=Cladophialophora yegresii CBS 114405 TaxID=1182544 RepID=W9W100_9EURO|nr:uncharacterized protein A1O7_02182 [Cladophialophora yegresii CBS 114405]EXJ61752.1 hypothetical protein A1O7_02182 [Cladophialophora yegresii CBS 114405]